MKKVLAVICLVIALLAIYLLLKPKAASAPQVTQEVHTSTPPTPVVKKLTLNIKDSKLTNPTNKFTFTQGDTVEITVTSDISGEVHFHGYDKHLEAEKDKPVSITFPLTIAGSFPFELEETTTELGTLIVNPK
jgi:hypothetical protein